MLLRLRQLWRRRLCPQQHPIRWAEPMRRSFRSEAVMGTGMGGAITAVAAITTVGTGAITTVGIGAITTVGTAATTMAGGIITIGGDFHLRAKKGAAVVGGLFRSPSILDAITERAARIRPRSSPRRVLVGQLHAPQIDIRARQRASKLSESSSAAACASIGSLVFAIKTPPASGEPGAADASLGHASNDFESMGLPAYQHFLPSMRR